MLFCYVSIINTVKRGNALSAEGDLTDRQRKIERDVTIVSLYHCSALLALSLTGRCDIMNKAQWRNKK